MSSIWKKLVLGFLSIALLSCGTSSSIKTVDRTQVPRPPAPKKSNVPSLPPEKLFENGKNFFNQQDFNKAFDYFHEAGEKFESSGKKIESHIFASRSLFKANRYHDYLDYISRFENNKNLPSNYFVELSKQKFESLIQIQNYQSALIISSDLISHPQLQKDSDFYRIRSFDLINSKFNIDGLNNLASNDKLSVFRPGIFYRLGEMSLENQDRDDARKYFSRSLSAGQQSEWSQRAQEMLDQLEAVRRVESKTIGVILPLTGKNAAISQKTLRGIQIGLGLYNNYPSSFKLAVIDSEGNSDQARRGVERLVKEDNVIAIIGSLLSKTAPAVAAKANELGLPSLALSQKSGITEVGPHVFRNSLTSEMQVRFLVKEAMENQGLKRFAILFPNDPYGIEFSNIFWDEVKARGGTIVAAQSYSNKETDFRNIIQRLVGTFYIEARSDEYNLRYSEWSKSLARKTARTTPPADLLPPIVDFDAIFIPDSVRAMGQISAMLSFNRVKGVKLLGTNLWNTPDVAKRAGHFASHLIFVDSFVSSEARYINSSFVKDYKAIYNELPGIFEIQGYDAALILRNLISQGATSRESLSRALSQLKDFPGAVGPLSMNPDREIMRPLIALSLDSQGKVVNSLKASNP